MPLKRFLEPVFIKYQKDLANKLKTDHIMYTYMYAP